VIEGALANAGLTADGVGFVCAVGLSVDGWDVAESRAIEDALGDDAPVVAFSAQTGCLMGAAGAFRSVAAVHMLRERWLAPILGLDRIDPRCAGLDYVREPRQINDDSEKAALCLDFSLDGVHSAIVIRRWTG
jgi:3-oxoacyl-[acyl-carrier-protein] synthase II